MAIKSQNSFPANLCLAPFVYLTLDPAKNISPCPALGGGVWNFNGQTIHKIWNNQELNDFRTGMINNQRHAVCARCWEEESIGLSSQRTRLWDMNKDPNGTETKLLETEMTPCSVIDKSFYSKGPMQLAIKVGNVCNLRCRSCNSADSVTLHVEAKHYQERYKLSNQWYLLETETKSLTEEHVEEIVGMSQNLHRLEFYGGEPLLDKQLPRLLEKLIDANLSQQISINISTNITQDLSEDLYQLLLKFKGVNISLSIDGWADKFTYLRHPADWSVVYRNIKKFMVYSARSQRHIQLLPVTTVTIMNVFDLPELVENLNREFRLKPFFIIARRPEHYSIKNIPVDLAQSIINKLKAYNDYNFGPIINAMSQIPNPAHWSEFKQWTSVIDQYRNENFVQTFPDYSELIAQHDPNFLVEVAKYS